METYERSNASRWYLSPPASCCELGVTTAPMFIHMHSRDDNNAEGSESDLMSAHAEESTAEDDRPSSQSTGSTKSSIKEVHIPLRTLRQSLGRGKACISCRARKLKCSGEKPCTNCSRGQTECHYKEITERRKSRRVLLEEQVVELRQRLLELGETLPSSRLSSQSNNIPMMSLPVITGDIDDNANTGPVKRPSMCSSVSLCPTTHSCFLQPGQLSPLQLPFRPPDFPADMSPTQFVEPDVPPGSPLEFSLINFVLPYAPHLMMPLHPQRFLTLLKLPPSDTCRPHPALMYILFAEAARILEAGLPPPKSPPLPISLFPQPRPTMPIPESGADRTYMLPHVRGMSIAWLERARTELDNGIRSIDRPFDLARAAVGITRYLYSLGRFMEGWNIPVSRLIVSCGLHRDIATAVPSLREPDHSINSVDYPQSYSRAPSNVIAFAGGVASDHAPTLRVRSVLLPPARDEIDVAERVMAFWAAKAQDWEAGIGRGWSLGLADEECTTQWPWGSGAVEERTPASTRPFYNLADLHDLHSFMHTSGVPDTTYVLAIKSLALLHRASHLSDLPISSIPIPQSPHPTHIPSLSAIQSVEAAISAFRLRIPFVFRDHDSTIMLAEIEPYDGPSDPWWIMVHANIYTAQFLTYKELAHYSRADYERAVSCARALVRFVGRVRSEQWCHVNHIVALDVNLAARFLDKEARRLAANGHPYASRSASEEAEVLRVVLARGLAKYLPGTVLLT